MNSTLATSKKITPRRIILLLIVSLMMIALIVFVTRSKPIPVTVNVIDRGDVEASISNTRAGTVKA